MPKGHALSEATKDAIWKLRATGVSDREIGRQVGLPRGSVSNHLARTGGIRPRARRRPERCLSLEEREEISRAIVRGHSARAIARALGRSHTTVAREINRCGARHRYRAHAAEREAWRRSQRPRQTKLELCCELRRVVEERLEEDYSPEQIAGWLRLAYPDNEAMQVSHETIYRALYVQARGTLKRELSRHLRRGRSRRYARSQSPKDQGQGKLTAMVMISERPPEVEDRAVPGHWEGDLLMGGRTSAIATLVERQTRYCQLVALPDGTGAEQVADALKEQITTLPAQLRRSLTWDQGSEMSAEEDYAFERPSLSRHKLRRLELKAGDPPRRGRRSGSAASKREQRHARELSEQVEQAYRRLVADWEQKPRKSGAGATPGRASSSHLTGQAARQGKAPDPAL